MSEIDFEEKLFKRIIFKVILLFVVQNLLISTVLYVLHVNSLEEDLFGAIIKKTETVGNSVVSILQSAVKYGIPLDNINGGTEFLNNKVKFAKELNYIIVTDEEGKIVAQSDNPNQSPSSLVDNSRKEALQGKFMSFSRIQNGLTTKPIPFNIYSDKDVPLQITYNGKLHGYVHASISHNALNANITDIFYDIAVILFVALIIGYEFLTYIFSNTVIQPMRDFTKSLKLLINKDFSTVITPRTFDMFGNVLQTLNERIIGLSNLFNQTTKRFQKISENHNLYHLIKDAISEVRLDFNFKDEGVNVQPPQPIVNNLRLIMFLVVLAEALVITSIPAYSAKFYQASFII